VSSCLAEIVFDFNVTHGITTVEHIDFTFLNFDVLVNDWLLRVLLLKHDHKERPNALGSHRTLFLTHCENFTRWAP